MKRLGFVGIIIEDREKCSGIVNDILSDFSELILARTGSGIKVTFNSIVLYEKCC